jgi:PadR family transcriptional regulator PadR
MTEADLQLRKFQKELSAGIVALVLLAELAKAESPLYGYQIAKQLAARGEDGLANKQSALYPVLRNLEAAGLLSSEVEPSVAGPPRRYYQITDSGRAELARWSASWSATRQFVDAVLQGSNP